MNDDIKKDFVRYLKTYVSSLLNSAGVNGVTIETYSKDGEPKIELSGTTHQLFQALEKLNSFAPMLIVKH